MLEILGETAWRTCERVEKVSDEQKRRACPFERGAGQTAGTENVAAGHMGKRRETGGLGGRMKA